MSASYTGVRPAEWIAIATLVVADQMAKLLVVREIALHESVPIVPGLLDLTHVRNTGAAFGFLNGVEFAGKPIVIVLIALLALVAVAAYAAHLPAEHRLARAGLISVIAGAAGNLVDRIRQGYVVDFVDAYWGGWHFWAFNVADAAITIGVAIIILDLLRPAPSPPASA